MKKLKIRKKKKQKSFAQIRSHVKRYRRRRAFSRAMHRIGHWFRWLRYLTLTPSTT